MQRRAFTVLLGLLRILRDLWSQLLRGLERRVPRIYRAGVRNRILLLTILIIALVAGVLNLLFGGNLASVLVTGLVVGSVFVLGATGLSLLYGIKKFANFAHGELVTLGTYMAYIVNVGLGLNIALGLAFSLAVLA